MFSPIQKDCSFNIASNMAEFLLRDDDDDDYDDYGINGNKKFLPNIECKNSLKSPNSIVSSISPNSTVSSNSPKFHKKKNKRLARDVSENFVIGRPIIKSLKEAFIDINSTKKKRVYLSHVHEMNDIEEVLDINNSTRIEMENIAIEFVTDDGKKVFLRFTKNNKYGGFSICLTIFENDEGIELYSQAYQKKEIINVELPKKNSGEPEKVFYNGRVFIVNNKKEFEKSLETFCCRI
jgi:hypothetical protein